jgi:hypothetical protein
VIPAQRIRGWMPRTRIPCGHPAQIPRAWFRPSSIHSPLFKSSYYQDLSLSEWLTHTPPELVMAHLHIEKATLDALPKEEVVIVPA